MMFPDRFKNIILIKMVLFSAILLSFGCKKDSSSRNSIEKTNISIEIGTILNSNDYLHQGEYRIESVRIITFDGDRFDQNEYVKIPKDDIHGRINMTVRRVKNKVFYVIVNEPTELKDRLDDVSHLGELEAFKYNLTDYFTDGNAAFSYGEDNVAKEFNFTNLPMSGIYRLGDRLPVYGDNYEISVNRALARVDIWVRGKVSGQGSYSLEAKIGEIEGSGLSFNSVSSGILINDGDVIYNPETKNNYMPAKNLAITPRVSDPDPDQGPDLPPHEHERYKRAFTFYTPERQNIGLNRLLFTLTGVRYDDPNLNTGEPPSVINLLEVDISRLKPIPVLEGNVLYSVYCTIVNTGEVSFDYRVGAWDDVEINVPNFE